MDIDKLRYLIQKDEGPKLDFKEDIDLDIHHNRRELAKDIVAIANSQGGRGYLIYGVEDKTKKIVGVEEAQFEEERIQQIISLTIDPPVNIRIEDIVIDEKVIVVITIFKSHNRPHQSRQTGAFYIRRGSTTDVARIDEIASLFQKSNLIGNERFPLYNYSTDLLNFDLINRYLEKINIYNQTNNLELLSNLGIINYDFESKSYCPTLGGMLFFCETPQNYLSYLGIKIIDKLNKEEKVLNLIGNIVTLLNNSISYIEKRIDFMEVDGLIEAITNAIVHRDYFDRTREIVIYLSKDRIIITNPGSTIGNIKFSNLRKEKNHKRRNFWIYKTFITLDDKGYILKNKNGLRFVEESLSEYGKVKFLASRELNIFKTVVDFRKKKKL